VAGGVLYLLGDVKAVAGNVNEVANDALVGLDISGYGGGGLEQR